MRRPEAKKGFREGDARLMTKSRFHAIRLNEIAKKQVLDASPVGCITILNRE
jgi:hypothetical protein